MDNVANDSGQSEGLVDCVTNMTNIWQFDNEMAAKHLWKNEKNQIKRELQKIFAKTVLQFIERTRRA